MFQKGYKMTEEHKKKIGLANSIRTKEYWDNHPEHYKRMSEAHKWQKPSKELIEKNRLRMLGGFGKKIRKLSKGNFKHGKSHILTYRTFYNIQRRIRKRGAEGSHTVAEWELLKKQYGYKCPCCGKKEPKIRLTEDHIVSLIKGGSNYIENIQPLCKSCNSRKNVKVITFTFPKETFTKDD